MIQEGKIFHHILGDGRELGYQKRYRAHDGSAIGPSRRLVLLPLPSSTLPHVIPNYHRHIFRFAGFYHLPPTLLSVRGFQRSVSVVSVQWRSAAAPASVRPFFTGSGESYVDESSGILITFVYVRFFSLKTKQNTWFLVVCFYLSNGKCYDSLYGRKPSLNFEVQ